jgi:hypothetical protein
MDFERLFEREGLKLWEGEILELTEGLTDLEIDLEMDGEMLLERLCEIEGLKLCDGETLEEMDLLILGLTEGLIDPLNDRLIEGETLGLRLPDGEMLEEIDLLMLGLIEGLIDGERLKDNE